MNKGCSVMWGASISAVLLLCFSSRTLYWFYNSKKPTTCFCCVCSLLIDSSSLHDSELNEDRSKEMVIIRQSRHRNKFLWPANGQILPRFRSLLSDQFKWVLIGQQLKIMVDFPIRDYINLFKKDSKGYPFGTFIP